MDHAIAPSSNVAKSLTYLPSAKSPSRFSIPPGTGIHSGNGEHPATGARILSSGVLARFFAHAFKVGDTVHVSLGPFGIPLGREENRSFLTSPPAAPHGYTFPVHPIHYSGSRMGVELVIRLKDGEPTAHMMTFPRSGHPSQEFSVDISRFSENFGKSFLDVVHELVLRHQHNGGAEPISKPYITRHYYDATHKRLIRMNVELNNENRTHKMRQTKSRPDIFEEGPVRISASERASPSGNPRRRFTLQDRQIVKVIGYSDGTDYGITLNTSHAQSTGTTQKGVLCVTDGMGSCIGVAIGGEVTDTTPTGTKASIRVFHVFPRNDQAILDVALHVQKLKNKGLAVKAALHGGRMYSGKSVAMAQGLRALFDTQGVTFEFDEAVEKRGNSTDPIAVVQGANTPLGAVIKDDGTVVFITDIVGR